MPIRVNDVASWRVEIRPNHSGCPVIVVDDNNGTIKPVCALSVSQGVRKLRPNCVGFTLNGFWGKERLSSACIKRLNIRVLAAADEWNNENVELWNQPS